MGRPQRLPTSIRDNINDGGIVYALHKYVERQGSNRLTLM
nr:MAG TPA: hypothetical protein [Caudoviricetes sp.]